MPELQRGERTRVLVIEDGSDEQLILRTLLEFHGYSVVMAGDGLRGIELAQQCRPEIVVLDLAMPRLSGIEVAKFLRSDPELKHVPILVVTAFPDLYYGQLRSLGIPLIQKPVDPALLLRSVETELQHAESQRAQSQALLSS